MLNQSIATLLEFLAGLAYIFGFVALLGVLTVFMFLLLTQPIWSKKLASKRAQGLKGWKLIKEVFA